MSIKFSDDNVIFISFFEVFFSIWRKFSIILSSKFFNNCLFLSLLYVLDLIINGTLLSIIKWLSLLICNTLFSSFEKKDNKLLFPLSKFKL